MFFQLFFRGFQNINKINKINKINNFKISHKIYSLKIKSKHNSVNFWKFQIFSKKYHCPKISENQCPTIFGNSWSMNFSKFMVHEFFGIHGPWFFEIQCPKDFCNFGLFNRLAQAGGGGGLIIWYFTTKNIPS